jgi:transcriptional regulator GlxA family with amidase domain
MATPKHLNLGVYIPTSVQLLDLSPIDILGMLDPKYLAACQLPAPIIALGIPSTIHYISVPSSGPHVELTASALIRVSKTIDDPDVQPGKLDVLLIPGPDPATIFEEEALQFVRAHATWANNCGKKADILSICTGCILLAQSGVVKGKNANGPRAVIPMLRQKYPDVKWIDDKRWTRDGNIWSSGKT